MVVTSRAQNPTGAAVSPARAKRLRGVLAAAPGVLAIEDDHAAELAEVPLAALGGAGTTWAFVRSVSKPYGPDLRVAVVAGDEATIARVEGRMRLGAGWVSTLLQRLVVELWRDEAVSGVVERASRDYAGRREALRGALAQRGIVCRGRTGINVWVPVADEGAAVAGLRILAGRWLRGRSTGLQVHPPFGSRSVRSTTPRSSRSPTRSRLCCAHRISGSPPAFHGDRSKVTLSAGLICPMGRVRRGGC